MPPKVKVSKEDIVNTAVEIVRQRGDQVINARVLAAELNCSTQPIFSNFATMEQLRLAMIEKMSQVYYDYLAREVAAGQYPAYKASGMAYIRFAKEEKEMFKLLFMCDRTGAPIQEDAKDFDQMVDLVRSGDGLDQEAARLFHLEMWVVVHGIATMFATGYLDLDWELVSRMLTDTYQGLRKQYNME